MRVLGVEISGSDSLLVVLDGTATSCAVERVPLSRLQLPAAGDEADRLIAFKRQVLELLGAQRVGSVGVIRADPGSSPIRAKIECMIQAAAKEMFIPCSLIAAQTVDAALKRKVKAVAGVGIAQSLLEIRPAYLRKAVHCAWSILNAKGE